MHWPSGSGSRDWERTRLRSEISTMIARLASRRTFIYSYASRKYYELNFGGVANDAFGQWIRLSVDSLIGKAIPQRKKV